MKHLTLTFAFVLLLSVTAFAGPLATVAGPAVANVTSTAKTIGGYVIAGVLSLVCIRLSLAHLRLLRVTSRSVAQRKKELAYRRSVHRYYRQKYRNR